METQTRKEIGTLADALQLNEVVNRLIDDIDEGSVVHLELVPEWAHEAIEQWVNDVRHSRSVTWMNHVRSAVRYFYRVGVPA